MVPRTAIFSFASSARASAGATGGAAAVPVAWVPAASSFGTLQPVREAPARTASRTSARVRGIVNPFHLDREVPRRGVGETVQMVKLTRTNRCRSGTVEDLCDEHGGDRAHGDEQGQHDDQ